MIETDASLVALKAGIHAALDAMGAGDEYRADISSRCDEVVFTDELRRRVWHYKPQGNGWWVVVIDTYSENGRWLGSEVRGATYGIDALLSGLITE